MPHHFAALVVGSDVEGQLDPYHEDSHLEFVDIEYEHLRNYETGSVEKVVMPSGKLLNHWDPSIRDIDVGQLEHRLVTYVSMFDTFEQFMSEWCGFKERDKEYGRYGRYANPNAKWDWCQIGGRMAKFKTKSRFEGTDSCHKNELLEPPKWTSVILIDGHWYDIAEESEFIKIWVDIPDDALLTIVDCHI